MVFTLLFVVSIATSEPPAGGSSWQLSEIAGCSIELLQPIKSGQYFEPIRFMRRHTICQPTIKSLAYRRASVPANNNP
jgi:hypothetical protein